MMADWLLEKAFIGIKFRPKSAQCRVSLEIRSFVRVVINMLFPTQSVFIGAIWLAPRARTSVVFGEEECFKNL